MTRKSDLKHRQKVGYKYIAKTKPSVRVVMEVPTSKPPPEVHFVRYKRLCHPIGGEGPTVSKRPKVKEVQELWSWAQLQHQNKQTAENKVRVLEDMVQRAILTFTGPDDLGKEVTRDFLRYIRDTRPLLVGQWTGTRWLDTNFTHKAGPMVVDQTSVTLDQWGDHIEVTDRTKLATKLIKKVAKKVQAMKAKAKRSRR